MSVQSLPSCVTGAVAACHEVDESLATPERPHSLSPYTPLPMLMMAADLFSRIVLLRNACGKCVAALHACVLGDCPQNEALRY
jgi:hypothetical protein